MPKRTQRFDQTRPGMPRQLSLFDIIVLRDAEKRSQVRTPGICNIAQAIRRAITDSIKHSGLSRAEIAERMSEMLNVNVSPTQIDCWTAGSKKGHRFPAEFVPAFCAAVGCNDILQVLAGPVDCYVLETQEALLAELGEIEEQQSALAARRKEIKRFMQSQLQQRGVIA